MLRLHKQHQLLLESKGVKPGRQRKSHRADCDRYDNRKANRCTIETAHEMLSSGDSQASTVDGSGQCCWTWLSCWAGWCVAAFGCCVADPAKLHCMQVCMGWLNLQPALAFNIHAIHVVAIHVVAVPQLCACRHATPLLPSDELFRLHPAHLTIDSIMCDTAPASTPAACKSGANVADSLH